MRRLICYEELIEALQIYGVDAVYERLLDLFYTEPFIIVSESMRFIAWDEEELYRFLEITYTAYKNNNEEVEL
jgi:hypothetical protein